MNKTLEFYRKLAEAYKEHGFEDYAVAELWTALEKAVLDNAELLEALEDIRKSKYLLDTRVLATEAIRKAKEK